MRTIDRYTYIMTATAIGDGTSVSANVTPAFSKFNITDRKDNDNWVFRRTTDCEMTFTGSDAMWIISDSVYTQYSIDVKDERGNTAVVLMFKKTDCAIDVNHVQVKVKPYVEDDWKPFFDGLDNEYNLVDIISPDKKKTISFVLKPTIQLYTVTAGGGDSEIHVYSAVGHSKASVTPATDMGVVTHDNFAYKLSFTAYGHGVYLINSQGKYASSISASSAQSSEGIFGGNPYARNTNGYQLLISNGTTQYGGVWKWCFKLYDINSNWLGDSAYFSIDEIVSLTQLFIYLGNNQNERFTIRVYATLSRIMSNSHGNNIQLNDIYPAAYSKCYRAYCSSKTTGNTSNTDTGYGRIGNTNTFYAPPDNSQNWIPLYPESWHNGLSIWLQADYMTPEILEYYSSDESVSDFYTLNDAIRAILSEIDNSIEFTDDYAHSQFLNSPTNPVTGQEQGRLHITQKSNLLNLQYDYPAWKAPCKLSQIFTMLRNAFNCYYDIYVDANGQKHLRIEHLLFYINGYSYTSSQKQLLNLKSIQDGRNGLPFSFRTNNWKYKTDQQPIRYEFAWMDTQSEAFAGFPIVVPDKYRIFSNDSKEDRSIDWFSTDFDFLLSTPSECSSDGFVLAETEKMDTLNVIDITISANGKTYIAQNGRLAFMELHPKYMPFGLYADEVLMNNENTPVIVRRVALTAYNDVSFKVEQDELVSHMMEVLTECGTGAIEQLTYDMTSGHYKATLNYDIR